MKRTFSLLLLALAGCMRAAACDVCGCSASNQYLGLLPQYQYNFVGLQYQYSQFSSSHPSLFEGKPDEQSNDYYHTAQVWGRYNITSRLQAFAFVPYRISTQYADGVRTSSSGIGDVSFLLNYLLLRRDGLTNSWKQQLFAGGGVKLPTGSYTGITAQDKQGLPNMQPGTGSWDFVANANYTVSHASTGLNADVSYTMTTANAESYKYGNRLNAGLLAFHSFELNKSTRLIPQLGARYEYGLHDYDNYGRRWLNEQSGGYMCFAAAGVQAYYKQFGARLMWQLPVAQRYGNGYVTAEQKVDAGFFFLF